MSDSSRSGSKLSADEAAEFQRAQDRMLARYKLIESMIHNNQRQLKNESARGGTEIEIECAKRDVALPGGGIEARRELEMLIERLKALQDEHVRLVAEREWLNETLHEFDNDWTNDEQRGSRHS